jgi:hypothetical protein
VCMVAGLAVIVNKLYEVPDRGDFLSYTPETYGPHSH